MFSLFQAKKVDLPKKVQKKNELLRLMAFCSYKQDLSKKTITKPQGTLFFQSSNMTTIA